MQFSTNPNTANPIMFQGGSFSSPSTSSPFGQTPFGKPATTGFSAPVFGSTGTGNLFGGNTTQPSGGLFGGPTATPSFGQPQTTQTAFGGFTSASSTGGLFGAQQNASPGLFGSNTTSAFGQAKPAFGGFGAQSQPGSLFGQQTQQQQQPQQGGIFGQPATQTASGLFGGTSAFGTTATAIEGTTTKFVPVSGTDTMMKNGISTNINTRHHCITSMKEYEGKSLEELRLEDYLANRKGPQQGVQSGGLFGAQPLFGANTNTTGTSNLFGATENKSMFGTGTQGFGTGANTNVFGGASTGNTLFGKPAGTAAAFSTPSATAPNTFGFGTNTAQSNPFGTNTAQKPFGAITSQSGGLFGTTQQPATGFGTQNTGFGGFGTTQPAQNGGLFGQNKSPFGMNTNMSLFNQPTSTTGTTSMFGAKPATTGFGTTFGQPTSSTTGFGTGGFGAPNQNTSTFGTNFKGQTSSFAFGQPSTTNTLGGGLTLGGGSSLFGNTANKPGGLFGGQQSTGLFGNTGFGSSGTTFNTGSTLGGSQPFNLSGGLNTGQNTFGSNQGQQYSNPLNQPWMAVLASMPFGDSPLFKNLHSPSSKTDDLIKPTSPATQKAVMTGQNYKVSPKSTTKVKVTPFESSMKTKGLDGEDEIANDVFLPVVKPSPMQLCLKPKNTMETSRSFTQLTPTNFINQMSPAIKTSPKVAMRPIIRNINTEALDSSLTRSPQSPHSKKSDSVQDTTVDRTSKSQQSDPEVIAPSTSSSSDSDFEDTTAPELETTMTEHITGIKLRRAGYYTIPSLDEIAELMDHEGRCIVDNFTIGRLSYGNIFYKDSFDVSGLNLDEIVHFRQRQVIVYPDDDNKPPVGKGLNRPAQVTLDRVWPIDKSTRAPITDPARIMDLDYEKKLRRVCIKHKTKFLEYRPQTGSWVFKVDHFSKYGLSDSDEEEGPPADPKKMKLAFDKKLAAKELSAQNGRPAHFSHSKSRLAPTMLFPEEDEEMDDAISNPYDLDEEFESNLSPTGKLGKRLGTQSEKVQLMKASFFEQGEFPIDGDYLDYDDMDQPASFRVASFDFDAKKLAHTFSYKRYPSTSLIVPDTMDYLDQQDEPVGGDLEVETHEIPDEILRNTVTEIRPKSYVLKHKDEIIPYKESSIGKINARCLTDITAFKGRGLRFAWAPGSKIILSASKEMNSLPLFTAINGRDAKDLSPSEIQLRSLYSFTSDNQFKDTIIDDLHAAFKYSTLEHDENGKPFFTVKIGTKGLQNHKAISEKLLEVHKNDNYLSLAKSVWGLCSALWGELTDCAPDSHESVMIRKGALSDWLETQLAKYVEQEIRKDLSKEGALFSYMVGHKISEACEKSDHFLALLLASSARSNNIRSLVQKQLVQWAETEADAHIDLNRIKCLMLVAGLPVHKTTPTLVNTCLNLNWLQAFAVHLWYISYTSSSITDALDLYEKSFLGGMVDNYSSPPVPNYNDDYEVEFTGKKPIYDIMFHLLKLFSTKSYPLEQLLNPATYTPDPLDYRLCWFLMRVLFQIGYSHLSTYATALIHRSFASQLEAHGLWHWAVFVLLHLKDPVARENAVVDVVGRNVALEEGSEEEIFLQQGLGLPKSWVYNAKATLALRHERYHDAAKYLIKAENWSQSHEVIMKHIVAKAIIKGNNEYLQSLLSELAKDDRHRDIKNWTSGGSVIYEYLMFTKRLQEIINTADVECMQLNLDEVKYRLTHLGLQIRDLNAKTPFDKLYKEEMISVLIKLLKKLQGISEETVNSLFGFLGSTEPSQSCAQNIWLTLADYWHGSIRPEL